MDMLVMAMVASDMGKVYNAFSDQEMILATNFDSWYLLQQFCIPSGFSATD